MATVDDAGRDLVLNAILALPLTDQPRALSWLMRAVDTRPATPPVAGTMTGREAAVLGLLAQGEPLKDIAAKLFISPATVRAHLRNLTAKAELQASLDASAGDITGKPVTTFPVRLPQDHYAALKAWCAANSFSMATVVRGLVEKFLADQGRKSA